MSTSDQESSQDPVIGSSEEKSAQVPAEEAEVSFWQLVRYNSTYRFDLVANKTRNIFFAATISTFGDWFNELAVLSIIMSYSNSGFLVAGFFIARELVPVLATPLTGLVGDRFDRRRVMVVCDLCRAVVVLAFLLVRSKSMVWLIYPLASLQYLFSAFFIPTQSALLPQIVPEAHLVKANSLFNTAWCLLLVVGGAAGGAANELLGSDAAFLIDSGTYLLSAFCVWLCWGQPLLTWSQEKTKAEERKAAQARGKSGDSDGDEEAGGGEQTLSRWQALRRGLSYLRQHPYVFCLTLAKGLAALSWSATEIDAIQFSALNPIRHSENLTLSLFYVSSGLGTLSLSFGLAGWLIKGTVLNSQRWIFYGSLFMFTATLVMASVPWVWAYLLANIVRTSGSSAIWLYASALLQRTVPNHIAARVFAIETAFMSATSVTSRLLYSFLLSYTDWGNDCLALSNSSSSSSFSVDSNSSSLAGSLATSLSSLSSSSSAEPACPLHHRLVLLCFTFIPLVTSIGWGWFNVRYNEFGKTYEARKRETEMEQALLTTDQSDSDSQPA